MESMTHYLIHTTVVEVNEIFRKEHIRGAGPKAEFRDVSRGWFAILEGSYEALHLGMEKPELKAGDKIELRIRKVA